MRAERLSKQRYILFNNFGLKPLNNYYDQWVDSTDCAEFIWLNLARENRNDAKIENKVCGNRGHVMPK